MQDVNTRIGCADRLYQTVIARYYNEKPKPIDDRKPFDLNAGQTEKLLAREFWRGQMHGGTGGLAGTRRRANEENKSGRIEHDWSKRSGPIHARHMRSRCFVIPRGMFSLENLASEAN